MQGVELFDAGAYGLSAAEAAAMDPQHRWAHRGADVVWAGVYLHTSGRCRPVPCDCGPSALHRIVNLSSANRLVLEAAGEALGAGVGLHAAKPAQTGVFVGISWTEYARMAAEAGAGE